MAKRDIHISEEQRSGRLVTGGKITSLAAAFSLADNESFSIFLTSKTDTTSVTTQALTVTLLGQDTAVAMPFRTEQWSELLLTEMSINESILSSYDIYWASGDVAEVSA